jgi:hypothetical protein
MKEARALEIMRDRRWKSDSQIVRERGNSFREVIDQVARDEQYIRDSEVSNEEQD